MQIVHGEVWLDFEELLIIGIKEITIKMGILRKSPLWFAIRNPSDGRKRLIRYATLAPKYREAVQHDLCGGLEPNQWLEMKKAEAKFVAAQQERDDLEYRLEEVCESGYVTRGFHYPGMVDPQLKCLCRAAGIVEETARWHQENGLPIKDHGPVKQVAAWLKRNVDDYFPLKYIPTHYLRLMEKLKAYAEDERPINEVISLPRKGNDHRATQRKEMWWQQVAIHLRTRDRNYSQSQIFRKVREMAGRMEKEPPSEATLRRFLSETETLTVAHHTDPNNKKLQRHRASMPLAHAMFADDCWEMDGTQVQIMGHLTGQKTKSGRAETKMLYVVAVRDVYSRAYLGYWYGYAESEHAYRYALQMAVAVTGRLPVELRYDQFPGSNSAGWKFMAGEQDKKGNVLSVGALTKHGVKRLTKTSSAAGKAHAERGFYTLQQVFERERPEYLGQGIKSSLANARPTEKYIARVQRDYLNNGWDFDQAWMSHSEVMEDYNNTPRNEYSRKDAKLDQSPWQMYENGATESQGRTLEPWEVSVLFWNARREGIRNGRIEFTDRGNRHRYYIGADDFHLLDYQREGVKLTVRHDPSDFSEIMVFNDKDEHLATLTEQADIQTYGQNPDWEALGEFKKGQKAISEKRKRKLDEFALSDEVAIHLPTQTPKATHNSAQTAYMYRNAGEMLPPKEAAKPAAKTGPFVEELTDEELEEYRLSQW